MCTRNDTRDEKFIIVDANVWLKGLVCYEHVGVVHGSDSPTISKFLEKNRQKLLAPAAARGEVRRNLGMVQVGDRPPEYDSNAKNILRKLCKDAGCPELRRELSVRTWNTFKEYTRGRNQHKYIRGNDKKQLPGRVDEIWKMFEYIFYNDYEKYYTYSIRKSSNMGGKDISPCRTPKDISAIKIGKTGIRPPVISTSLPLQTGLQRNLGAESV